MYHATYAHLNNEASTPRLERLVKELKAQHCEVKLDLNRGLLNVNIPDDKMWWVLTGCITVFFDDFKDVADWSFKFMSPSAGPLTA